MFHQYHLHSTSTSSRAVSHTRAPSVSSIGSCSGTPASHPALSSSQISPNTTAFSPTPFHPCPPSDSLEDPISLGIRQHQDDDVENSSTQLTPQHIKHLKTYAKKLCKDLSIEEKAVFDFINTGGLFSMLVDIKATFVTYNASNKASELQVLQETLTSKDFEAHALGSTFRLLACILSPNITAYVTDTQHHIMEFIANHLDIFKIPATVLNDNELQSTLGKIVMRLLADLHSYLKSHLTVSIVKQTCIIKVGKAVAHSSPGMEVDASHWARLAFLRCCLRLFLIGVGDHKIAPLSACFTPRLIPMLKSDMHTKVEHDLSINISEIERWAVSVDNTDESVTDTPATGDGSSSAPTRDESGPGADFDWSKLGDNMDDLQGDANSIVDAGPNPDADTLSNDGDDLDPSDSGFGLDGRPVHFNITKFWNYVNYMLNTLRWTARKNARTKELYDRELHSYMMQIFQDDLAECPGMHRGSKIVSVINPEWQTRIQQGLTW
ncbi:hypothetical protein BKA82DRAFT_168631 [Pisolithus tinctorius]|uniref:Uncharacterized protein n=1 Tax=Pisolithus tinctorius Marx 270 TaxID=870435 RepID=A0A0C3IB77_PISTI|nr:hypothetical protein BKA82DRAFT_168631 [Pisolithus tinctorius]KIN94312.1 hypothetical protein M404DRAFT_168631 [Pisolithus tinctorius Marx 270]